MNFVHCNAVDVNPRMIYARTHTNPAKESMDEFSKITCTSRNVHKIISVARHCLFWRCKQTPNSHSGIKKSIHKSESQIETLFERISLVIFFLFNTMSNYSEQFQHLL